MDANCRLIAGAPRCKCQPKCEFSVQVYDAHDNTPLFTYCEKQARKFRDSLTFIMRPDNKRIVLGKPDKKWNSKHFTPHEVETILSSYPGKSYKEIGALINKTPDQIKKKLQYMRKKGLLYGRQDKTRPLP